MSIRFNCTACHTVLKIGEAISAPRKVRCTGCGIVILLTPDEDSPTGITASFPEKAAKPTGMSDTNKRIILGSILGVVALIVIVGVWWQTRGPADRGAVEGEITLDSGPLEKGTIIFISQDPAKPITAGAPIVRGRYSLGASNGPAFGRNKVEIRTTTDGENIAVRYNEKTTLTADIKPGSNTIPFEVKSK